MRYPGPRKIIKNKRSRKILGNDITFRALRFLRPGVSKCEFEQLHQIVHYTRERKKHLRPFQLERIWIVIPAFNEECQLARVLSGICRIYPNVVVVEDGSTDRTIDAVTRYPVAILRHSKNLGQGAALRTGIEFALSRGAEIIVSFDADGQHRVQDIESLITPIVEGEVDLVLGTRFPARAIGISPMHEVVLRLAVVLTRWFSRIRVTDTHNGLRAFSKEAAVRIRILCNRRGHASEILHQVSKLGLRYREVPVTIYYPEKKGKIRLFWESLHAGCEFLANLHVIIVTKKVTRGEPCPHGCEVTGNPDPHKLHP